MLVSHFFSGSSKVFFLLKLSTKLIFETRRPRLKCTVVDCPTMRHCLKNSQRPLLSGTRQKPRSPPLNRAEVLPGGQHRGYGSFSMNRARPYAFPRKSYQLARDPHDYLNERERIAIFNPAISWFQNLELFLFCLLL